MIGAGFVVGMIAKIAVISAFGMGSTIFMNYFNKLDPKINRKKGEKNEQFDSEPLRERARSIR